MFHWGRGSPARASGGRSLTGGALRRRAKSTNGIIEEDTGKTGIPAQYLQESRQREMQASPRQNFGERLQKASNVRSHK